MKWAANFLSPLGFLLVALLFGPILETRVFQLALLLLAKKLTEWLAKSQSWLPAFPITSMAFAGLHATNAEEEQQERCTAWGSVGYTAEIDFRNETTDDTVIFHLYVRPETFMRYARKIAASEVDKTIFCVAGVSGFYSDWPPSISTSKIKVLTKYKEHAVEIPDGCQIVPPELGEMKKAALTFHTINNLESARADTVGQTRTPLNRNPPG